MSTAQVNQLLVVMFVYGDLWPALKVLFMALGSQEGQYFANIDIQTSASASPFKYPICGDNTD